MEKLPVYLQELCRSHEIVQPSRQPERLDPNYFKTQFRREAPISEWPGEFTIITAYATTGTTWTVEENDTADRALGSRTAEDRSMDAASDWLFADDCAR